MIRYRDPTSDTESEAFPWTDIHVVGFGHNNAVVVYVPGAPDVDPTEQWIAYGLVVDDDGDGIADRRFGMDNIPGPAKDLPHRAWITDLHTGRTESSVLNSLDYFESPEGIVKTPMVGDTSLRRLLPGPADRDRQGPVLPAGSSPGPEPSVRQPAALDAGAGARGARVRRRRRRCREWRSEAEARHQACPLLRMGIGDRRWPGHGDRLCPGCRVASSFVEGPADRRTRSRSHPPIDSLEEALAAVGEVAPGLTGFLASDTRKSPARRPGSRPRRGATAGTSATSVVIPRTAAPAT